MRFFSAYLEYYSQLEIFNQCSTMHIIHINTFSRKNQNLRYFFELIYEKSILLRIEYNYTSTVLHEFAIFLLRSLSSMIIQISIFYNFFNRYRSILNIICTIFIMLTMFPYYRCNSLVLCIKSKYGYYVSIKFIT
jgi:hypothetical protein